MVYVNPDTRSVTVTDHDYHKAANDNEKGSEVTTLLGTA